MLRLASARAIREQDGTGEGYVQRFRLNLETLPTSANQSCGGMGRWIPAAILLRCIEAR
jgi:hypothetical protein